MKISHSIPYLKLAVGAVGLYAGVWMALEASLVHDGLLAAGILAVGGIYIITKRWGGQRVAAGRGVAAAAGMGVALGGGLGLLMLFLMALKTGLHAHGPEYTAQEVAWLWWQLPLWAGVGGLAGLGVGLLAAGRGRMATDRDG